MNVLAELLINGLAVFIAAYILPGVHVENYFVALIVAVVLGIINTLIKPILVFFTLPITIVTLGLFLLVINAILVMIVANIVAGFSVESFWWALLFGLVLSIINGFLSQLVK